MDEDQNICREVLKTVCLDCWGVVADDNSIVELENIVFGDDTRKRVWCETFCAYVVFLVSLCKDNLSVFDEVNSCVDKTSIFTAFPRLRLEQVYEVLQSLKIDNAEKLLSRLECDEETYSNLCNYLDHEEKDEFMKCLGKCKTQTIANNLKALYIPIWIKKLFAVDGENSIDKFFEFCQAALSKVDDNDWTKSDDPINSALSGMAKGVKIAKMGSDEINISIEDFVFFIYLWFVSIHNNLTNKLYLTGKEESLSKSILCCVGENEFEKALNFDEGNLVTQFPDFVSVITKYLPDLSLSENEKHCETGVMHQERQHQLGSPKQEDAIQSSPSDDNISTIMARNKVGKRTMTPKHREELLVHVLDLFNGNKKGSIERYIAKGYDIGFINSFFKKAITGKNSNSEYVALYLTASNSEYRYKEINLQHFCHIIAFLVNKGVIVDERKVISNVLFDMATSKGKKDNGTAAVLSNYICKGKNEIMLDNNKKNSKILNCLNDVLTKMEKKRS